MDGLRCRETKRAEEIQSLVILWQEALFVGGTGANFVKKSVAQ